MSASSRLTTFRSPVFSLMQSALHETLQRHASPMLHLGKPGSRPVSLSADHPAMEQFVAAATQKTEPAAAVPAKLALGAVLDCAKLYVEMGWAEIKGDIAQRNKIANEIKFGPCDLHWKEAVTTYLAWRLAQTKPLYRDYQAPGDFVLDLPAPATPGALVVGILGDWGTGTDAARWLLDRLLAQKPDLIIHLGDIYYSGTKLESQDNFAAILKAAGVNVPVYTLCGNHDMYDGGAGYYELIAQLGQPASFFCLRNDAWQILALDTGHNDCNPFTVDSNLTKLPASATTAEAAWHLDKLDTAAGRRTILLSHHQLFTAYGDGVGVDPAAGKNAAINPNLLAPFQSRLDRVALWLWGHEHNLNIFEQYAGLARGRCMGASAVPVPADEHPYKINPDLFVPNQGPLPQLISSAAPLALNASQEYNHAFAVLRLAAAGQNSTVDYYQIDSANQQTETLVFSESL